MKQLQVGDIVRINDNAPFRHAKKIGFVYETYQDFDEPNEFGVQIILEDGEDTGGWSREEQKKFIEFVKSSGIDYEFKNVIRVAEDFRNGVFKFK